MKAILVIDIDDSLIEGKEKFAVDGYLMQEPDCVGCYETVGRIRNAVLKPIPIKKEAVMGMGKINFGKALGWNACLDAITGEIE